MDSDFILLTGRKVDAPVLLPAGFVLLGALRAFLAIADGLHPVGGDAEIVYGRMGQPLNQRRGRETEAAELRRLVDPQRLMGLRQRLAKNRDASALFDLPKSTRNIEAAYTRMWQTWVSQQNPVAFSIESA